jgi:hypothetical protein
VYGFDFFNTHHLTNDHPSPSPLATTTTTNNNNTNNRNSISHVNNTSTSSYTYDDNYVRITNPTVHNHIDNSAVQDVSVSNVSAIRYRLDSFEDLNNKVVYLVNKYLNYTKETL